MLLTASYCWILPLTIRLCFIEIEPNMPCFQFGVLKVALQLDIVEPRSILDQAQYTSPNVVHLSFESVFNGLGFVWSKKLFWRICRYPTPFFSSFIGVDKMAWVLALCPNTTPELRSRCHEWGGLMHFTTY